MQREVHDSQPAVIRVARPRRRTAVGRTRWSRREIRGRRCARTLPSNTASDWTAAAPPESCWGSPPAPSRTRRAALRRDTRAGNRTSDPTHARIAQHVIEHVHPHRAARSHAGASRPPRRTQEDVVSHNLKGTRIRSLTLSKAALFDY